MTYPERLSNKIEDWGDAYFNLEHFLTDRTVFWSKAKLESSRSRLFDGYSGRLIGKLSEKRFIENLINGKASFNIQIEDYVQVGSYWDFKKKCLWLYLVPIIVNATFKFKAINSPMHFSLEEPGFKNNLIIKPEVNFDSDYCDESECTSLLTPRVPNKAPAFYTDYDPVTSVKHPDQILTVLYNTIINAYEVNRFKIHDRFKQGTKIDIIERRLSPLMCQKQKETEE